MRYVPLVALSLALLTASGRAAEWALLGSTEPLSESLTLDPNIGDGPFSLEAEVVLERPGGTAASVRIGEGLNFGFDGRGGQLFVEGRRVGDKVQDLGDASEHVQAGKPFRLRAVRDAEGRLVIHIGESEIFSKAGFGGETGSITFRPHRGVLTIRSARIEGDFVPPPKERPTVLIHRQGEHDCHTFRIPAIVRTNDGTLLAVYDMRYRSRRDLQGHMDIGLSRSTDGGATWAAPRPIMDMGEFGGLPEDQNGCSDPNILVDAGTGEILVSAVWTHGKPGTHQWVGKGSEPGHGLDKSSQFMIVRSSDDGLTWSAPENWTERLKDPAWHLFAPAPGNGITLKDGTLVMPTQGRDATGLPFSNLMWSRDHGKSWTLGSHARDNTTECAVAELADGSLMLNMRDNRNRSDKSETNGRAVSVTTDLGKTWTVHPSDHGALPEPVCMASLISHELPGGKRVLFFSNPKSKTARKNMTVRASLDGGLTWPEERQITLDLRGGAYSSLVMADDQTLGIIYEGSRADMVFQTIALEEFGLDEKG